MPVNSKCFVEFNTLWHVITTETIQPKQYLLFLGWQLDKGRGIISVLPEIIKWFKLFFMKIKYFMPQKY